MIISLGKKVYGIGAGWINLAKSHLGIAKEETETLAVRRLALCLSCETNVKNICRACGCPVMAKVRSSNESCPKQKW
jgi:hypothetical protein